MSTPTVANPHRTLAAVFAIAALAVSGCARVTAGTCSEAIAVSDPPREHRGKRPR